MDMMTWILAAAGMVVGYTVSWALAQQRITALSTRLHAADADRGKMTVFHERALTAEAQIAALEGRLKEQQEQMRLEFKTLATAILDENSKKFGAHSEKQIGELLTPVRERLVEFQKLVGDSFTAQRTEQNSLKNEIGKIVMQADSLTKALRGDVKAQGNWGEVMLERILEESGLRKDDDYIVQGAEMGLTAADGSRQQPDVIVKLPEGKHIIIDAKVSLTAYERYCASAEDTARELHVRDFLKSMRAHITGLEQRRYQDNEKLMPPDFVFMFIPIEGAFSFALQQDPELQSYAWGRKIVMVSPAMLFSNLRTIASLWRIETQNKYAQEIARQGGALYDKFAGFVEDMEGIDRQIAGLHKSYDSAMNKLKTGRGNLMTSAEKLKILGAKASKSLPVYEEEASLVEG